jgi:DNA-binding IclR family transcriptional regulator
MNVQTDHVTPAPVRDKAAAEFVEALAKGLAVIEAFDEAHGEMTLSEVARRAGMTPAAARRSLHTLTALGYMRHVNRRFMLDARVLHLGAAYLRAAHVEEILLPELVRLVRRFGDAASVTVLDGQDILYVAHHSEQRARRMTAGVGVQAQSDRRACPPRRLRHRSRRTRLWNHRARRADPRPVRARGGGVEQLRLFRTGQHRRDGGGAPFRIARERSAHLARTFALPHACALIRRGRRLARRLCALHRTGLILRLSWYRPASGRLCRR